MHYCTLARHSNELLQGRQRKRVGGTPSALAARPGCIAPDSACNTPGIPGETSALVKVIQFRAWHPVVADRSRAARRSRGTREPMTGSMWTRRRSRAGRSCRRVAAMASRGRMASPTSGGHGHGCRTARCGMGRTGNSRWTRWSGDARNTRCVARNSSNLSTNHRDSHHDRDSRPSAPTLRDEPTPGRPPPAHTPRPTHGTNCLSGCLECT